MSGGSTVCLLIHLLKDTHFLLNLTQIGLAPCTAHLPFCCKIHWPVSAFTLLTLQWHLTQPLMPTCSTSSTDLSTSWFSGNNADCLSVSSFDPSCFCPLMSDGPHPYIQATIQSLPRAVTQASKLNRPTAQLLYLLYHLLPCFFGVLPSVRPLHLSVANTLQSCLSLFVHSFPHIQSITIKGCPDSHHPPLYCCGPGHQDLPDIHSNGLPTGLPALSSLLYTTLQTAA